MTALLNFLQRNALRWRASQNRERSERLRGRWTIAEWLEHRHVPSAASSTGLLLAQTEIEPNDTLDQAQDIGFVDSGRDVELLGSIGDGTGVSTDVDWFRFTLESIGRVQIDSVPNANGVRGPVVLTLYSDQLDSFDPTVPLQHRLLARCEVSSADSTLQIDQRLTAGTYFVAVSGAGNRYFHPFLADSGVPGEATDYDISVDFIGGSAPPVVADQFAPNSELPGGDDTSLTATNLGDFATAEHLQVSGVIGDDRFYNAGSGNPFAMNPAADVDLYHFSVTSDDHLALVAEAFAGRIGSPLDPALTLFRVDDAGGLQIIASNDNTLNSAESANGQIPLFTDSLFTTGLSAGDYYLAVSSSGNNAESGGDGVFDPSISHSGINGSSTGAYVLNLLVYTDAVAPEVIATTPAEDATLGQPPRTVDVQFSEAVNVQQLAYSAFTQVGQNSVRAVFVEGQDGTRYFPRLQSYDVATNTAHFLMLDGLPNGQFELHVSGPLGLTDWAGNPVTSNNASGDFVARFNVAGTPRGSDGNSTQWQSEGGNDSFETAQNLGVLFPHELQSGVSVVRNETTPAQPEDTGDFFRFELLQTQAYFVTLANLSGESLPSIEVVGPSGNVIPLASPPGGQGLLGFLHSGTYTLHLGPWDAVSANAMNYRVEIKLGGAAENPTPLTNGAGSAVGIRLIGEGPLSAGSTINTSSNLAAVQAIPSGLNANLAALPVGLSNLSAASGDSLSENRLVRLFGFSERDRLFTLLDSSLSRLRESITQLGPSDADLLDLVAGTIRNQMRADDAADAEEEQSAPENSEPVAPAAKVTPASATDVPAEEAVRDVPDRRSAAPLNSARPMTPVKEDASVDEVAQFDRELVQASDRATSTTLANTWPLAAAAAVATLQSADREQSARARRISL